jgi:selenocysteine lyase/cysteine desulfurase
MATLFGTNEAFDELEGPNHFFIDAKSIPYKFEPGGVSSVGGAGILALRPYFQFLSGQRVDDRATVVAGYQAMEELEAPLTKQVLEYLATKDVTVYGDASVTENSVATISFTHATLSSAEIVAAVHRYPVGIRHGHMYAYRLCQALGVDPTNGVVRISMVHYNSEDEVEVLIRALESIL